VLLIEEEIVRRFESRSLPTLPRDFTFYVAHPIRSIHRLAQIQKTKKQAEKICVNLRNLRIRKALE